MKKTLSLAAALLALPAFAQEPAGHHAQKFRSRSAPAEQRATAVNTAPTASAPAANSSAPTVGTNVSASANRRLVSTSCRGAIQRRARHRPAARLLEEEPLRDPALSSAVWITTPLVRSPAEGRKHPLIF